MLRSENHRAAEGPKKDQGFIFGPTRKSLSVVRMDAVLRQHLVGKRGDILNATRWANDAKFAYLATILKRKASRARPNARERKNPHAGTANPPGS